MNTENKTPDRRVRKTKKALRESLIAIMKTKNIRDITVQELSDQADVNRATFYLHYKDIHELLQQIENQVSDEINGILDKHMPSRNEQEPYPLFVALLTYIKENADLCKMLLSENSVGSFRNKLCLIVEERCLHTWPEHYCKRLTENALIYFSSYIVNGYVAAIEKWIDMGMRTVPEALAKMLGDMGLYGIGFLEITED